VTERDRYLNRIARQEQERLNRERRRLSRPPVSWRRVGLAVLWGVGLLAAGSLAYLFVQWTTAGLAPAGGMP